MYNSAAAIILLAGLTFLQCQWPADNDGRPPLNLSVVSIPGSSPAAIASNNEISESRHNAITNAVSKVSAAVCGVNVTQKRQARRGYLMNDPFFDWYFRRRPQVVKSLGSGFLISENGYILTNEHVVRDADQVVIALPDGSEHEAEVIGMDALTDIALVKIDGDNHPFIQFGDSEDLIIGEWVIALGNPFGLFEYNSKPTVTVGVISATDRDFGLMQERVYQDMIQTDAAINSGNSGGPLVNSMGYCIGMNTFIYTGDNNNRGSVGIGFAIPSNRIREIVAELQETGEVNRQWTTGLAVETINRLEAKYLGLDEANGLIVTEVERGSPAENAGLRMYDIIVEVNDKPVNDPQTIIKIIKEDYLRGGDSIKLKVFRDKKYYITALELKQYNGRRR
jgi:serine protease Do